METTRRPGVPAPGMPPRPPFGGKRRLFNVVPVRFDRSFISELYNAGELFLSPGDPVVVDTTKGPALAEVCGLVERQVLERGRVRRIIRRATSEDQHSHAENKKAAREAFRFCLKRIRARDLPMKLCQVEYMLDQSRVLFYFSAEHRVDFRQLVRDLARHLNARIEMRQIGVRDGAGLVGGIGPCGKELCCSSFLTSFRSISIRHAKDQGLTLNPKKVSGMCGRLMCCLVYEHPTYRRAKKGAPRVNRAVRTAFGDGVVTEVHLLQRHVRVLLAGGSTETLPFAEVIVDNTTILRPREIAAATPSRPRRSPTMTRAGSNLGEQYVWDGAEADDLLMTDAEAASEAVPPPSKDAGRPERSGRRRRRRRPRGGRSASKTASGDAPKPAAARPAESGGSADSGGATEAKSGDASGDKPPRRRRRRRRRRGGSANKTKTASSSGDGDKS